MSFMACGGSSEKNATNNVNISQHCGTSDNLSQYIEVKSGDQIIKEDNTTDFTIFHDRNGQKRVCLHSGKASIKRTI